MPVAITLRLDGATAAQIAGLVEALPDRQTTVCDPHQSYPAHIKLAVYGNGIDVADLDAALATATGNWKRFPVTLAAIGAFLGNPPTLWLAPVPTVHLLTLHMTLHRALADLASHPDYEIDAWMPHVALARTELLGDAVEVAAVLWTGPINGWFESLDLIRYNPVEVLSSRPLRD